MPFKPKNSIIHHLPSHFEWFWTIIFNDDAFGEVKNVVLRLSVTIFKERLEIFDLSKRSMTKDIRHFAGVQYLSLHMLLLNLYNLFPTVSPPPPLHQLPILSFFVFGSSCELLTATYDSV